ncbi:TPA: hypothetical protein RU316_003213 [Legionella pneumophila]|nr:hypothetical protein [Legionella pneumophila subsp. pneumophila]HDU8072145.1 hypothetical protein [Legionella pneumophila]HDZ9665742.1 hypothetical protein [Legionella pneumophila]HEL9679555.1 hypothetical protein [Legionella pneumophila]HEM0472794.1 hypothetical protein [Legionella pneumophila]
MSAVKDSSPADKESVQGQILPFASILKNYKSYKSTQWEQRARSDPSPNTQACLQANSLR